MTTPAINRNSVTFRPGRLITQQWEKGPPARELPPVVTSPRNVNYLWDSKVRPESGSSPPQGQYGWRPCRAWTHKGAKWVYPANTVTLERNDGTFGAHFRYENGSFWGVTPPVVPSFPGGLINQAEIKALNRLKDQNFNLGQFLAEFDQTERMIASKIISIAKSVKKWRRHFGESSWKLVWRYERQGAGRRFVKKIPPSWLELQYGWRPLLSDIYGAVQQLSKPDREPLIHCNGYAESRERLKTACGSVTGRSSASIEHDVTHKCWVSLYYKLNNPGLATQSQLGLLNPFEIVWECLPYSFVVDWFLPIGPWMSSLTADAGFTFKGGSRSLMSVVGSGETGVTRFENYSEAGGRKWAATGDAPVLTGSAFSFLRSCYANSPVPGLYVKNPLSATHVLNATALLIEAFRRH